MKKSGVFEERNYRVPVQELSIVRCVAAFPAEPSKSHAATPTRCGNYNTIDSVALIDLENQRCPFILLRPEAPTSAKTAPKTAADAGSGTTSPLIRIAPCGVST